MAKNKNKKTRQPVTPATEQVEQTPSLLDAVQQAQLKEMKSRQPIADISIEDAVPEPIGKEQIEEAMQILLEYQRGKAALQQQIVDDEQWYRMRHWSVMQDRKKNGVEPTSGWLFNALANKHADAMDNFPAPNILPREEGDKQQAKILSSIIPVILDQDDFEATYSAVVDYKLKFGTGIYGVFWDKDRLNGLGDITIKKGDILNLFWEPGITDIQMSRNFFSIELMDNDLLEAQYPDLVGKLGGGASISVAKYQFDDNVDTSKKSVVVDWYYKQQTDNGKQILQYCKFVNDTVLYASENDPDYRERGYYDHGMYPYIFDPLFTVEGSPCGFGYIDVGKNAQEYIDRGNKAILENMLANAKPRYFIRKDGGVNEEEYADTDKEFIHCEGNLGEDSIRPVTPNRLDGIYVQVINDKVNELKEVTGNRDISTGGTTSGVTAASAIAAMQEAGSKLSRDSSRASYRSFRKMVLMVIELIRQFYDISRCFRIIGDTGAMEFVTYNNGGLRPQMQQSVFGVAEGMRIPLFDIEISAEKKSPYSKMAQNELALQFYSAGFFNPQLADQALACLDMMDFDRKEFIEQKIAENGTMYQQLMMMQQQMLQMAQIIDQTRGTNMAQQMAAGIMGGQIPSAAQPVNNAVDNVENTSAGNGSQESSVTKNARKRVAESTDPT